MADSHDSAKPAKGRGKWKWILLGLVLLVVAYRVHAEYADTAHTRQVLMDLGQAFSAYPGTVVLRDEYAGWRSSNWETDSGEKRMHLDYKRTLLLELTDLKVSNRSLRDYYADELTKLSGVSFAGSGQASIDPVTYSWHPNWGFIPDSGNREYPVRELTQLTSHSNRLEVSCMIMDMPEAGGMGVGVRDPRQPPAEGMKRWAYLTFDVWVGDMAYLPYEEMDFLSDAMTASHSRGAMPAIPVQPSAPAGTTSD